ncbi:thyrotropin-releasing hormone receptor-like [Dendronephthya gigantea]|uniref:thyrotropin-releasing hormone receptor-like n=1 Tax=Dendronephthya gigantea TaxID=151771 RepID=UPI00106BAE8B|nr:thyrotropin-releasing hormone receptor-like [Dendronephthya gigantea]
MFNVSEGEGEVEDCYRTYIVTKPTTSYIINSVIGCIVNLILCFVGSFLNALVVYVFWKTPRLRYKVSYFMIMLLSSIDVLVTLIVHPAHLVMSVAEIIGKPKCIYKMSYQIAAVVLSGMSFFTFFVLNIERYLSIVHPIFHLQHVTKLRCLVVCIMLWSLAIFCGPVAYPLSLNTDLTITVSSLVVICGTFYIYFAIFYFGRRRRKGSQPNNVRRREENSNIFLVEDSTHTDNMSSCIAPEALLNPNPDVPMKTINMNQNVLKRDERKRSRKTVSLQHDLQLAKMCLLVVFISFALNLPNAVIFAVFTDRIKAVDGQVQAKIWTVTLVLMNSTVNCLIFFWANERLRKEGRKVCKRLCKC